MVDRDLSKVEKLKFFLESIPVGPVGDDPITLGELRDLLAACWYDLEGAYDEGMRKFKLERMEDVEWHPPELRFRIERHGGTMMGSTRAELQEWIVNLTKKTAECRETRNYRQLSPRDKPFHAGPVAAEVATAIVEGRDDPRLQWLSDREVLVLASNLSQANSIERRWEEE